MNEDLINRNTLVERFNYLFMHTNEGSPEHYAYGVALKEIREHPVAFDKESVIEQIRNVPYRYYNVDTKEEIVEIVEKGGIE